jgi:hypothetical protein
MSPVKNQRLHAWRRFPHLIRTTDIIRNSNRRFRRLTQIFPL